MVFWERERERERESMMSMIGVSDQEVSRSLWSGKGLGIGWTNGSVSKNIDIIPISKRNGFSILKIVKAK